MISYIKGTVLHKTTSYIILENAGIGYKVFAAPHILEQPHGSVLELYTYHKSTDDGQMLFGFSQVASLEFFELLLTVSGVGPKIALSILSAGEMSALKEAIARQDSAFFSQMGGIGKKTAERIIVDLKDKIGVLTDVGSGAHGSSDVFDALTGLGYSTTEARKVLTEIDRSTPMEAQLKQALKLLSK